MITTRIANDNDIEHIAATATASVDSAWTAAYTKDRLCRDDTLFLVAESDSAAATGGQSPLFTNCVIGFAVFRQVGDDGELLQIAVDESFRRCGAGSMLVDAGLKWAREKVLTSIFLEVRASNEAAIALYEKHGFKKLRMRKNYYSDPAEDAVVMVNNKL